MRLVACASSQTPVSEAAIRAGAERMAGAARAKEDQCGMLVR